MNIGNMANGMNQTKEVAPIAWLGPIEDWGRFRTSETGYHSRPVVLLSDYRALQQQLAAAREALQAAEALTGGRGTAMDSLVAAFNTWPDDIKKKLSLHDLRRMSGWAPRSEVGNWRIDTSAGGPILVYQNCSVIEGEQARYLINLIKSDNALAALMENTSPWECPYKLRCECLGACKHGHGIDATLQRDRQP